MLHRDFPNLCREGESAIMNKNFEHHPENDADFEHFCSYSGLNEFANDLDNGDDRFLALEWARKGFDAGSALKKDAAA